MYYYLGLSGGNTMNPEMPEATLAFFEGDSGEVATVNPADFFAVWNFMRRQTQNILPAQGIGMESHVYQRLCSPGANVEAVWYRASMITMLDMISPGWMGQADVGKVAALAATIPMKTMKVGVVHEGPPFDVQESLKQLAI
jgi:hypothetical protein